MNCIMNILQAGSEIIATAMVHIGSLCSSKEPGVVADKIALEPVGPVKIQRLVLRRGSLVAFSEAVARAGGYTSCRALAYIGSDVSLSSGSLEYDSDDDESVASNFHVNVEACAIRSD